MFRVSYSVLCAAWLGNNCCVQSHSVSSFNAFARKIKPCLHHMFCRRNMASTVFLSCAAPSDVIGSSGFADDHRKKSPLQVAARDGDPVAIAALLSSNEDPSARDSATLRDAARYGNAQVVERLLLDGRADPAACDNEAIKNAAKYGYAHVVELLLQDVRVDASAGRHEALRLAMLNGHFKVVRCLLVPTQDLNPEECRALKAAIKERKMRSAFEDVNELIQRVLPTL